ncbi:PHB depolymerase family esterase [Mucilaginibacter sp. PAMB04168]|uniref:carboxylesterase family protein n=1 Tax=Mucilaginibacter sp. PAMB04168 TaxID=3138567 RepID=UPI0031F6186E
MLKIAQIGIVVGALFLISTGSSVENRSNLIRRPQDSLQKDKPDPLKPDFIKVPLQEWEKPFTEFQYRVLKYSGHVLPYRLYTPPGMVAGKSYPLLIFMHGAGERGIDNRRQFFRFAPFKFWLKYPCYVLAPECPKQEDEGANGNGVWVNTPFGASKHEMKEIPTWPMKLAITVIDSLLREKNIDKRRVYVTGLSMGGFATWELLQRKPSVFAAAMPVCGGGDLAYASKIAKVPLWIFHGDADSTVPVARSRDMVSAIKAVRGKPRYTEYPNVGHDAWTPTYPKEEVWDWLFGQRQK